eukprot:GEZU01021433.1.p1 GENE.GEZU01021433.1~~GEZU01021433.1.p1  ORF type:complete len:207 (-),score=57.93 GEZU01021433.1:23-643(-)
MSAQQKIEARLSQLINTGDIPSLVQTCEEAELKYYQDANARPSPFFYSSWLLSLLIQNDLENARFLWKRIHKDTKKNSNELKAVWKIGQGMWNRDPAAVYQALTTYSWDTSLVPLVNVLAETYRHRMFTLVAKGYTNISLNDTANFLGMDPATTKTFVESRGWLFDAASQTLTPKKPEAPTQAAAKSGGLDRLKKLADDTLFLELN